MLPWSIHRAACTEDWLYSKYLDVSLLRAEHRHSRRALKPHLTEACWIKQTQFFEGSHQNVKSYCLFLASKGGKPSAAAGVCATQHFCQVQNHLTVTVLCHREQGGLSAPALQDHQIQRSYVKQHHLLHLGEETISTVFLQDVRYILLHDTWQLQDSPRESFCWYTKPL